VDHDALEACPKLTGAFGLLGKRWNALILDLLAVRPLRFSQLDQAIPGISDRMLGERLRELVAAGLLEHDRPPQGPAIYRLTDAGRSLQPALEAIRGWWAKLEHDSDRARAALPASRPAR
jgi:DNA-binding HxlR family transcriptional regulator